MTKIPFNEDTIRQMVQNELLTDAEIGEKLGCHPSKVTRFKTIHNIHKPFADKEWLTDQYVNQGKSIKQIAEELRTNRENIRIHLRKFGIETDTERARQAGKKYHFNERIFETIDTPEKAYWLGFITGDGCIEEMKRYRSDGNLYKNYRLRFVLAAKDDDHLKKFRHFLGDDTIPLKYKDMRLPGRDKIYHQVQMKICCKQLAIDLMNLGIMPGKSMHEKPPYMMPNSLVPHFVRGELDADGCIVSTKRKVGVSFIGSYELMTWIHNWCNLGKVVHRKEDNPALFVYGIYNKKEVYEFLRLIYLDATCYLDRKYNRYLSAMSILNKKLEDIVRPSMGNLEDSGRNDLSA